MQKNGKQRHVCLSVFAHVVSYSHSQCLIACSKGIAEAAKFATDRKRQNNACKTERETACERTIRLGY